MEKDFLFFYLLLLPFAISAQVPVNKEPRHHVVFENGKVRLLNVLLPPGDTTQFHEHSTPSVFIPFTKTKTFSQLIHHEPVEGVSQVGNIWFENLKAPNIKIHRVWNADTDTFHVMDVEILSKVSGFTQPPLVSGNAKLTLDTPWARTYKIDLARSQRLTIKKLQSAFVLIAISNGMITMIKKGVAESRLLQPATFFWLDATEQFTVVNLSKNVAHFALVEVR